MVPFANVYVHAVLLFRAGEPKANRYGMRPIDEGSEFTTPLVVSILALVGVSALFGSSFRNKLQGKTPQPRTFDLAQVSLQGRLQQNPCDEQTAYDLIQSYVRSRHYQDAIVLEKTFHSGCKKAVIQLKWAAYESALSLQNHDLALTMIDQLIHQYPKDADYYNWRGLLYEKLKQWEKAAADYEQVLRLKPKIISVPLNLVDAYRLLDQPCKARDVHRRYGETYPDMLKDTGFVELSQKLEQDCSTRSPS